MAVNVCDVELREPRFAELVSETLARHGIAPGRLCLEITERALVHDGPHSRDTLDALVALGVQLAVDDFGATHTSLARLPQFPVSVVRLERPAAAPRERGIVAAVIAMAHGLDMSVVGEGIETVAQLDELVELACDDGQGFLPGLPLSIAEVDQALRVDSTARRIGSEIPSRWWAGSLRSR
jgi:EAL domain-containing protein (putative c-di-GMP-specific phosphodiesterase class I)